MTARLALDELLAGVAPAPQVSIAGLDARFALGCARRRFRRAEGRAWARARPRAGSHRARRARRALGSGRRARPRRHRRGNPVRRGSVACANDWARSPTAIYGAPSSRLTVAGVTGTNGKTTCAWLLASAVDRLARRGAYLGTLGAGFPPQVAGGSLTTPDVISLHRQLRALADAGATHVAMEVSSHALDQRRVDGVRMRVAAFCNLSRDHLDYHGTMERYAEAKGRLFRLPGLEHAVINVGDPVGARFAAALGARRRADGRRGRRRGALGAALRPRASGGRFRGRARARDSRPLRRTSPAFAADRRLQCREPRGHACSAACLAVRRRRRAGRARRVRCAARAAWKATGFRAGRSRWSTTRTRPMHLRRRLRRCVRMRAAA